MTNISMFSHLSKIIALFVMLILLIFVIPYTYSKYESTANSNIKSEVAYYILNADYMTDSIRLTNLVPSDEPYIYTFTISNNDGTNRLETRLKYDLTILTTTNLPLTYELYMNEDYNNPSATNIIQTNIDTLDEHGTYFKEMKVSTSYFNYQFDEENEYTLLIYFPKTYISHQYQDLIDSLEIIIDSEQLLE